MKLHVLLACLPALLAPLAAQTVVYSPAGANHCGGGSGNTILTYGQSATFQQLHDYRDMNFTSGGKSLTIKGLSFRKSVGSTPWQPRTMEVQLTMGTTTVTLDNAYRNRNFAGNFSSTPTTVLPFTKISIPFLRDTGSPNPPSLVLPFKNKFSWENKAGNNLIWEWRLKNNTSSTPMFADAVYYNSGTSWGTSWGCRSPAEGKACTATGRTSPANASTTLVGSSPINRSFTLADVQPDQPALLFVGVTRQKTTLPGLCSSLELAPVFAVAGRTSSLGSWSFLVPYPAQSNFQGRPPTQLLFQYAFGDSGLPTGLGLSNMMVVNPPMSGMFDICALWAYSALNTNNNWATASVATGTSRFFGIVTGLHL